jgi:type IV secretion system protein VirB4
LDLTTTRLVTLDFTKIYEHEDLARAVILYMMHRISAAITEMRAPALIFIDETEPVVRHPMFRQFFLQMLQEYRKKGAAVISAFQRPEAIAAAGLGEAIRGQAQTTFFLPNPQAKESEYADWGLTDREMDFIKGRLSVSRRLRRAILVKRATGESVILDVDLSPLGPLLKVFRSDEPSKQEAELCMRKYGADWLRQYLEIPS